MSVVAPALGQNWCRNFKSESVVLLFGLYSFSDESLKMGCAVMFQFFRLAIVGGHPAPYTLADCT